VKACRQRKTPPLNALSTALKLAARLHAYRSPSRFASEVAVFSFPRPDLVYSKIALILQRVIENIKFIWRPTLGTYWSLPF